MSWVNLVQAVVRELPTIVKLGVDVAEMIPEVKKSIDVLSGRGVITPEDTEALRAKVAEAEGAWAEQVRKAEVEIQAEEEAKKKAAGEGGGG